MEIIVRARQFGYSIGEVSDVWEQIRYYSLVIGFSFLDVFVWSIIGLPFLIILVDYPNPRSIMLVIYNYSY